MGDARKTFVCIECSDTTKGCTHITSNPDILPVLCGPDSQGYVRCCKWREVPEERTLIDSF